METADVQDSSESVGGDLFAT